LSAIVCVSLRLKKFSSVSGILKKAAEKYLLEQGIDWREEKKEK
jgi:hypothetical protein